MDWLVGRVQWCLWVKPPPSEKHWNVPIWYTVIYKSGFRASIEGPLLRAPPAAGARNISSDSRMWRAHPAWIWRMSRVIIHVRCASCIAPLSKHRHGLPICVVTTMKRKYTEQIKLSLSLGDWYSPRILQMLRAPAARKKGCYFWTPLYDNLIVYKCSMEVVFGLRLHDGSIGSTSLYCHASFTSL
jgi:hypothetical protein